MTAGSHPATPPAGRQLTQLGAIAIQFRNNTFQFIDLRHFALPPGVETADRDVLAALINSPGYRGSSIGTGDKDLTIHGPYRAAAITTDSFVPVSATGAETWLRTWAEYAAPLPEAARVEVEREVYAPLQAATSVYQLPSLPDGAKETEWRLAIGNSTGFHECGICQVK